MENLIEKRLYNHEIDEAATIIDLTEIEGEPAMVLLQYDDGMVWDEAFVMSPLRTERVGANMEFSRSTPN